MNRIMIAGISLAAALSPLLWAQYRPYLRFMQADERSGELRLIVHDCSGAVISKGKVEATEYFSKKRYSWKIAKTNLFRLPYGKYLFSVSAAGFVTSDEYVDLWEPSATAAIGVRVGSVAESTWVPGPVKPTLIGTVKGIEPSIQEPIIARATGIFCEGSVERPVDEAGHFAFEWTPQGPIMLTIATRGRVLAAKPLLPKGTPTTVDLDASPESF